MMIEAQQLGAEAESTTEPAETLPNHTSSRMISASRIELLAHIEDA